jgi:hypothetical protein
VYFKPSHRYIERELEFSAKTKASTPLYYSSFAVSPHLSNFGITFTHLFYDPREEKVLRWALMIPFLAIHAKGGESMSPKQKDCTKYEPKAKGPHHHPNFKINDFQLDGKFQNWYLFVF